MRHQRFTQGFARCRTYPSPLLSLCALAFLAACGGPIMESPEAVMVEPSIAADSPAPVVETVTSRTRHEPIVRAGVLTAGDIDDTLNLAAFNRYLRKAKPVTGLPVANMANPIVARMVGPGGTGAPGVYFTLRTPGASDPFYSGYSGVDGNITIFPALHGITGTNRFELRAFQSDQGDGVTYRLKSSVDRDTIKLPFDSTWKPEFLDLAFVVDTTGSMGDELDWLTKELKTIVNTAKREAPGVDIRYGLIVYRDHGDDFVVRNYGFTNSQTQMRRWLRRQTAAGGGDYPEAAADALQAGASLNWRRGKGERLMFHIADAPPHHEDARAYLNAVRGAAGHNVQIFGLGASGVAAESEFLMRQAAVQTNGRYLFLTDDSGVGYGHAEPTISCYQVTRLNDLVARVLRSELRGFRIEASDAQVIRNVGNYQSGRCRS